jgi:hypothetical protein
LAITYRLYLFEENGDIVHIPRRTAEGVHSDEDALPQYANSRRRVLSVVLENQDGRPIRILDAEGSFWTFNGEGRVDVDLAALHRMLPKPASSPQDKVIDLRPEFERMRGMQKIGGVPKRKTSTALPPAYGQEAAKSPMRSNPSKVKQ